MIEMSLNCSLRWSCDGILHFGAEGRSHSAVHDVDDDDVRRGQYGVLWLLPLPQEGVGR